MIEQVHSRMNNSEFTSLSPSRGQKETVGMVWFFSKKCYTNLKHHDVCYHKSMNSVVRYLGHTSVCTPEYLVWLWTNYTVISFNVICRKEKLQHLLHCIIVSFKCSKEHLRNLTEVQEFSPVLHCRSRHLLPSVTGRRFYDYN